MRRHLRNTRRGWMIFNEADKGGAAGGSASTPAAEEKPGEKKEETTPTPAPAASAAPANPAPSSTEAAAAKPSVFARAAAMLKDKSELLTIISGHEATIAQRDATITSLNSQLSTLNSELTELKAGKAEIEAALTASEKKAATVSAAAVDVVASLGFPENKLPAANADGADGEAPKDIAAFQKTHGELVQSGKTDAGSKFYDKYARKFGL